MTPEYYKRFLLGAITGEKSHGRFTILGHRFGIRCGSRGVKILHVVVRCSCGNMRVVRLKKLRAGETTSCGCYAREQTVARSTIHGHAANGKSTTEYGIWSGMLARCRNEKDKSYPDYGGRGITVCDSWLHSFENFLEDMGARPSLAHSLDRFPNNDGSYEPDNCRWATAAEQGRNRRNNRFVTFNGETLCVQDWAERYGISCGTLASRLRTGWDIEKALTRPAQTRHSPDCRMNKCQ